MWMSLFKQNPKSSATIRRPNIIKKTPKPNHYLLIILDSSRYDTFLQAETKFISRLGKIEKRYSYATWTAPSHYNLLCGLMPHTSPPQVFASDYYKKDLIHFNERFGIDRFEFKNLVPQLYLPPFLRSVLHYKTHALVSLPVLNPATPLNVGFDVFRLMDKHNDMAAMLDVMEFSDEQACFYLLNVGETHYPYALPHEPETNWPRLHGVHGIFKHLDDHVVDGSIQNDQETVFFDQSRMNELRDRQIEAIRYLDQLFERLYDLVPQNTFITVTSDHGELFGEDGYFGHGPIMHEKVLEVPFVEGKIK
jgi:hypothetical protein